MHATLAQGHVGHARMGSRDHLFHELTRLHNTRRRRVRGYQSLSPTAWFDKRKWVSIWPRGSFMGGDSGNMEAFPIGLENNSRPQYDVYQCDGPGTQGLKFIMGNVQDASGNAVGGVVLGFRTSDNLFIRQTTVDGNGNYKLGTQYPNVNHYCIAYSVGSPDRLGTTLNTLVPTNIDGS